MQVDIQDVIRITKGDKTIAIAGKHAVYVRDVVMDFDFYYNAVQSVAGLVDYSTTRYHWVNGFPLFPIMFPSFAEPIATAQQYLDFAQLKEGMTVLDLGAYSGLTAILFAEEVGETGKVIAVDADRQNFPSIRSNIAEYHRKRRGNIRFIEGAMWSHSDGVAFSSEQNMGSAAVEYVGGRGNVNLMKSYTLSDIAEGLDKVDFIKVDIEGAETEIFKDYHFFMKHRPRMIVETHRTEDAVRDILSVYDYSVRQVKQYGSRFPLLECNP